MSNHDSNWPLVLSAETTVPSQTQQAPPQLALMNPTGEPFKIHEVRYSIKSSSPYLTGATVGAKLELGSVALTNGFVPVWNFGRVISYDQDLSAQFSWRLAHPIYVPAGGFVGVNFQNFGQLAATVTARVTYFASSLGGERPPRRVFLPYVSAYIGKAFEYTTADTDTSRETDLFNPFDTDLRISRLVGRYNVFFQTSSTNTSIRGGRLLSARVSLSNGDPLVRVVTPFDQIFGLEGRAWEQRNTVLKPKQYFQVFMEKAAPDDPVSAGAVTIQPYVSLVGYREMQLEGVTQ